MSPVGQRSSATAHAFRGAFLDFVADPFYQPETDCVRYLADGLLVVEGGKIQAFGPYGALKAQYQDLPTTVYGDRLILPGFIDTHIHYPQTEMIAAYGEQLLSWLEQYTFPVESKFADLGYAQKIASFFLDELLRNGTTTALVFATVHPASVDAFFEEAERRHLCMIAGKVMMDRNAPDSVCDTAASSYQQTKALIKKWHGKGRLRYAVTPRFAPTSTPEQLAYAGQLLAEFPDVYLHTHLSETENEVAWVKDLFPDCCDYLDVYDRAGLVTDRSVFAHGVQLTDREFRRLGEQGSALAHCPTSNLFLGSGLFNLTKTKQHQIPVGLATDVGGGTSFSLLHTMNAAYKVAQLQQHNLSAFKALFLATLGGAQALNLSDCLGNFEPGKDADFIVLNRQPTPLLALRNGDAIPSNLHELADQTFALMMLGDDRAVEATYILGEKTLL
ncbi:MAG: guanine deaminase [Cyanobacteria bacterium P01_A01_bin.105]